MIKAAFPEYWIWWLGLPVSLGILYLVYRRSAQLIQLWFSPDQYARSYPLLKLAMRGAGFLLLFISLIGPYLSNREDQVTLAGRDIYILLDVSASMNATDVRPSRLQHAKTTLQRLIGELSGDRIGLILFTEQAYVQCPLTYDHRTLSMFLSMAETEQYVQTGTQFRPALATALDRLVRAGDEQTDVSRAIILVSDGEDFGDSYASIVGRLHEAHVAVFAVGVGTPEGAPVPAFSAEQPHAFKKHADGSVVVSRLVADDLAGLAREFGTEYIALDRPEASLAPLKAQIYTLTATPWETRIEQVKQNQYRFFLFFAIALLMGSMFLMPIRKE
ncbi:MAG: VWA domain-containing protein [Bacteroidia bacterium]